MPELELMPCPFCASTNVEPYFPVSRESLKCRTFMECRNCGMFGPPADGSNAAFAAWYRRIIPSVHVQTGYDHRVSDVTFAGNRVIDDEAT